MSFILKIKIFKKNKNIISGILCISTLFYTATIAADDTQAYKLDTITVTSAASHEQKIKEATASISVITSEELENKQFNSLQDIVNDIPGVNVLGGGSQSGISIRGMEKGYTLILIDCKRIRSETGNPRELNNEDLDSNFIPPLSAIERIEVIRGPMSSLYGSDAMGGIINIITKKTPEKWSGSVDIGYTIPSNDEMGHRKQADYYLAIPMFKDLLGIKLWGYNKLQDEDEYVGGYQESDKKNYSGELNFTPNEKNDLFIEYSRSSQDYLGTLGKTRASGSDDIIDREWTRDYWGTGYNGRYNIGDLEIKYYQEDYERITANQNSSYTTGSRNQVGEAKFTTYFTGNILTFGYQWTKDTLTNSDLGSSASVSYGTRSSVEKSYFAENEWEIFNEKLFFTFGARLTDNQYFGNHWSPRGYLVYNLNDTWTIKGGVGTGYKSPKISQIDETTGSKRGRGNNTYRVVGNPDLNPEESNNYEIGAYYSQKKFYSSVTIFKNDFKNKIVNTSSYRFTDDSGNTIPAFECEDTDIVGSRACPAWATWLNLKGADVHGVEIDGKWIITDNIDIKGNYTYSHSEIDAGDVTINTPAGLRSFGETLALLDGNSLAGVPEHSGSLTLDYKPVKKISMFFRGSYESQLTVVSYEDNSVGKSDKDLILFDTGLSYSINKYLNFSIGVYNIFDEVRFKRNDDTDSLRYSERGRRFWSSLKMEF